MSDEYEVILELEENVYVTHMGRLLDEAYEIEADDDATDAEKEAARYLIRTYSGIATH